MTPAELKALAAELTEHMVAKGVRTMKLSASVPGPWLLEIELDPAAQVLAAHGTETLGEPAKPKPTGECAAAGCENRGGWLGTGYCRGHFQAELRGQGRAS